MWYVLLCQSLDIHNKKQTRHLYDPIITSPALIIVHSQTPPISWKDKTRLACIITGNNAESKQGKLLLPLSGNRGEKEKLGQTFHLAKGPKSWSNMWGI